MRDKKMTYNELVAYTEKIIHYATGTASRCYDLNTIYQLIDERIDRIVNTELEDEKERIKKNLMREFRF